MASAIMPTTIYSSGVFITDSPLLQALAGLGKTDERRKRDNGHNNDNQVKHTDPPRETASPQYSPHLHSSLQYIQSGHFLTQRSGRQGCGPRPRRRLALSRPSISRKRHESVMGNG